MLFVIDHRCSASRIAPIDNSLRHRLRRALDRLTRRVYFTIRNGTSAA